MRPSEEFVFAVVLERVNPSIKKNLPLVKLQCDRCTRASREVLTKSATSSSISSKISRSQTISATSASNLVSGRSSEALIEKSKKNNIFFVMNRKGIE